MTALPKDPPFGSAWKYRPPTTVTYIALCPGRISPLGGQWWVFLAITEGGYTKVTDTMGWRYASGAVLDGWEPA